MLVATNYSILLSSFWHGVVMIYTLWLQAWLEYANLFGLPKWSRGKRLTRIDAWNENFVLHIQFRTPVDLLRCNFKIIKFKNFNTNFKQTSPLLPFSSSGNIPTAVCNLHSFSNDCVSSSITVYKIMTIHFRNNWPTDFTIQHSLICPMNFEPHCTIGSFQGTKLYLCRTVRIPLVRVMNLMCGSNFN